ncbi:thiamine phosphate synthase [Marinomonas ostreistagni]|uniref:thiamine phosphate synthase n=1 Tax=Marinomonas ostreistagni TaxID=359209 RepID=UPI001950D70C|nr:thiamine phosphate synthase [Marinomonas ostreistagni]MBM6549883.1 thiamine phosphate synthase [Marinomonas ostreistagni]
MATTDLKHIGLTEAGFKASVIDHTRHLGCRVGHAKTDSARIEPTAQGVTLHTQNETWHFVNTLASDNSAYQACCQGNQVTVQLPDQRIAKFEAPKLLKINRNDLAVALACFIEQGYEHLDAMTLALAWLTQQARAAGAGWPEDRTWFPRTNFVDDHVMADDAAFSPIRKELFTLYPVVDTVEWLALVLEQGVTTAQLRIKDASDKDLRNKVQQAIALGEQHGAQVFINDYWQLAIELGAYGVHLGQEDIEVADLSAIQQAGLRLGISTHGYFEIMRAFNLKPSYIALGHIFPTVTKDMPSQPQGLTRLGQYVELIHGAYPTVAIGGINAERLPKVKATGVDSIALVTAITRADDPAIATQDLLRAVTETGDADAALCE